MNKLDRDEIKSILDIEYEQLCEDWRNRDTMLWQSLAIAVTLTGLIAGNVFNGVFDANGELILIKVFFASLLFLLSTGINLLLLITICKNHFYQMGSNELLGNLGGNDLVKIINESKRYDLRIYPPSSKYIKNTRISSSSKLYKRISHISAFRCYYNSLIILIIGSFVCFIVSLNYYLIEKYHVNIALIILIEFDVLINLYLYYTIYDSADSD